MKLTSTGSPHGPEWVSGSTPRKKSKNKDEKKGKKGKEKERKDEEKEEALNLTQA